MAANHPRQGPSVRKMLSPSRAREGGGGDPQLSSSSTASPAPFPPLSTSSDNTSNSNSSGASYFNSGSPGGERVRDIPQAKGERRRRSRRAPAQDRHHRALCQRALMENDAMVYLEGPGVYTCGHCRTHLTSHDDIISKSFHGRHGRAYLFDQCVNITTGPSEERLLITGLHSVCDISCKRCHTLIGWTYVSAYERSQKYKEGKFIIEKKFLHLEESDQYDVDRPAGERGDRWRQRSMSWGSERRSERSVSIGSHAERSWSIGSHAEMALGSPLGGASPQGPSCARGGRLYGGDANNVAGTSVDAGRSQR